jgi:hypothetical protein
MEGICKNFPEFTANTLWTSEEQQLIVAARISFQRQVRINFLPFCVD